MSSNTDIDKAGYGPLEGIEFVIPYNANLGTTADRVTNQAKALAFLARYPRCAFVRVKIYNPSASATLAWATASPTDLSAAAAITADFASTAGSHIGPGQTEYFAIQGVESAAFLRELYVVASAAGTSGSVTLSPVS